MSSADWVAEIETRLRTNGNDISSAEVGGLPCLIGYTSQFKITWFATKLHLLTIVGSTDLLVTSAGIESFANAALDYAHSQKGAFRGLQVGVAAIPILISPHVDATAVRYATNTLVRRYSAFAWPAVVDSSTGKAYSHVGSVMIGGVYANYMRQNTAIALGN